MIKKLKNKTKCNHLKNDKKAKSQPPNAEKKAKKLNLKQNFMNWRSNSSKRKKAKENKNKDEMEDDDLD